MGEAGEALEAGGSWKVTLSPIVILAFYLFIGSGGGGMKIAISK